MPFQGDIETRFNQFYNDINEIYDRLDRISATQAEGKLDEILGLLRAGR